MADALAMAGAKRLGRSAPDESPSVSRIVSLAPSNTEIAAALGLSAAIVGVCDDSDWPEDVSARAAKVGMDLQIDPERVAALQPDLVLASLSVPGMEKCVAAVRAKGLEPLVLDPKSLDDVLRDIATVGDAAGVPRRARTLNNSLRERLARVERITDGRGRPRVYWEWWPKPLISPGRKSWMVDLVKIAGGDLIFADVDRESFPLEEAQVIAENPEVVVLCWVGTLQRKQEPAKVYARKAWAGIRALKD